MQRTILNCPIKESSSSLILSKHSLSTACLPPISTRKDQGELNMSVKITVKRSVMVRPAEPVPHRRLWNSNLDLVVVRWHTPTVYFYRRPSNNAEAGDGKGEFFNSDKLEAALAAVMVPFYPMAGRLSRDADGRLEIDCNGEGALLVEAVADATVDDYGDFVPNAELRRLVPGVHYDKNDLASFPLLVIQVTRFKCGGVCLGFGVQHQIADGYSGIHFVNSFAELARGLPSVSIPPFIDRTLLPARDPPNPTFPHVEYDPSPSMLPPPIATNTDNIYNGNGNGVSEKQHKAAATETLVRMFKLTAAQLDALRKKTPEKFSSYARIAGHIWRCACIARELQDKQLTKLYIAVDGRTKLKPPLPNGFSGNVIFTSTPIATAKEVVGADGTVKSAASRIQEELQKMDDKYMKSALDYLELQPDLEKLVKGPNTFSCPNLGVTSWTRLPIYDCDFGWGSPVYVGPGGISCEGLSFVLPSVKGDGDVWVAIALQAEHMDRFQEALYNI